MLPIGNFANRSIYMSAPTREYFSEIIIVSFAKYIDCARNYPALSMDSCAKYGSTDCPVSTAVRVKISLVESNHCSQSYPKSAHLLVLL